MPCSSSAVEDLRGRIATAPSALERLQSKTIPAHHVCPAGHRLDAEKKHCSPSCALFHGPRRPERLIELHASAGKRR